MDGARSPVQLAARLLLCYALYWAAWAAVQLTRQFATSTPDSALTQYVPHWASQTALAAGPLLVAVAVAASQRPLKHVHHMCALPQRTYWTLLVPACLAAAAGQWLAEHRMPQYFGMAGTLVQAAQPLLVMQFSAALGLMPPLPRGEGAVLAALAVAGPLPLLPRLRLASACVLVARLACSALAPVLLQALMQQQESAPGAGVVPVLVHVRGWRLVAVQLQLLTSLGAAMPRAYLCYPWLLIHSCAAVAQEALGLVLLRDTGALVFELFATLIYVPYPAIWGLVMSYTPFQSAANVVSLAGSSACLASVGVQRLLMARERHGRLDKDEGSAPLLTLSRQTSVRGIAEQLA